MPYRQRPRGLCEWPAGFEEVDANQSCVAGRVKVVHKPFWVCGISHSWRLVPVHVVLCVLSRRISARSEIVGLCDIDIRVLRVGRDGTVIEGAGIAAVANTRSTAAGRVVDREVASRCDPGNPAVAVHAATG